MNIGIIGAGHVGTALANGWMAAGHHVVMGSRDPLHEKYRSWKQDAGELGNVASFNEAARFGEMIVVALPWSCLREVLMEMESSYLMNKTLIDVSNAVQWNNGPRLMYDHTSAGELVQEILPDSFVVKALNTVSACVMVHPEYEEGMPVMFVSGNANHAKDQVRILLQDLGWSDIVDLGDIQQSRLQESIMVACVISEMQMDSPGSSFALLKQ